MSYVDFNRLKSPSDPSIPFLTRKIAIPVGTTTVDSLQMFGLLVKAYRIVNLDSVNSLSFTVISLSGQPETIEPSTEASDVTWTSLIQITTNAVTGSALLEMELVQPELAYRI